MYLPSIMRLCNSEVILNGTGLKLKIILYENCHAFGEKLSIHSEDFVTPSLVIIIKEIEFDVEATKKESSDLPAASLGGIFNMIWLPKERK